MGIYCRSRNGKVVGILKMTKKKKKKKTGHPDICHDPFYIIIFPIHILVFDHRRLSIFYCT